MRQKKPSLIEEKAGGEKLEIGSIGNSNLHYAHLHNVKSSNRVRHAL